MHFNYHYFNQGKQESSVVQKSDANIAHIFTRPFREYESVLVKKTRCREIRMKGQPQKGYNTDLLHLIFYSFGHHSCQLGQHFTH